MSIAEMCALAELSRAGHYRFLTTPAAGVSMAAKK